MQVSKSLHYIWIGNADIPVQFMYNYEHAKTLNKDYQFKLWNETDILPILGDYTDLFMTSSLFHKLQLAKYIIINIFGGIYSDFDIEWKTSFDNIINLYQTVDLVLPKRKSLYFFNKGQKTVLIDDFVIMATPKITQSFLEFCLERKDKKDDVTEPFSVYALTEWCLGKSNIDFFTPEQIYDTPDGILGYHYNQRTWK